MYKTVESIPVNLDIKIATFEKYAFGMPSIYIKIVWYATSVAYKNIGEAKFWCVINFGLKLLDFLTQANPTSKT